MKEIGKRFKNMGKVDGRRNVNEDLDEKKEEEEEEEGESRLNSPELGHTYLIGEQGEYYVLTPVRGRNGIMAGKSRSTPLLLLLLYLP